MSRSSGSTLSTTASSRTTCCKHCVAYPAPSICTSSNRPTTLSSTSTLIEARRSSLGSPNRRLQVTCSSHSRAASKPPPPFGSIPREEHTTQPAPHLLTSTPHILSNSPI